MGSILVTGSNRGIGLELARAFARQSWRVFATCRDPDEAAELRELDREHALVSIHQLDVRSAEQRARLAHELKDLPVDILFNNAGVFGPEQQAFGEIDVHDWLETLEVNTIVPFLMAHQFLENVTRSNRRIIASVGSLMGSLADNTSGGYYAYRTSKAGVHMVMRGLAADLASRGVISVAFHPGWVRTRMGGSQAPVSPEESAAGLQKVLLGLGPGDTGKFFDYTGRERPW